MKQQMPFLFVCCQVGTEGHLKRDIAKHHPELRFAFSRPGFVTFKVSTLRPFHPETVICSVFARTWGVSLGAIANEGDSASALVAALPSLPFHHLHVWKRDANVPGECGFEPFHDSECLELGKCLRAAVPGSVLEGVAINRTARVGQYVADVIIVEPDQWFYGWHQARSVPTRWPGGVPPLQPAAHMVSRAYLKMEEALRWSQFPIASGDRCVEIGSSPGGSCQALLDRGCHVTGIDPAEMDERLLAHPNFVHMRARAADLKRKEFADFRWLMADANIAPPNTLDAIEEIVTHRRVHIRGMLITLKLLDDTMVEEIDRYLERIRSWGYAYVRARQLAFNRREFCVAAVPSKNHLRRRWRRQS